MLCVVLLYFNDAVTVSFMVDVEIGGQHVHGAHPSILNVINQRKNIKEKLSGIKHRIGVYSAKGGVGKTTVAINMAYTLSSMGYKVGLLDADIDTPNVMLFLGKKDVVDPVYPLKPMDVMGVRAISTGMYVDDEKKPIIWRGPMVGKMIREFFENTEWGDLDYLILDLPPGTSDAPLSIMQLLELDGIVLVTTPQKTAATNAVRSGLMAKRLGVALLGVVETMSFDKTSGGSEVAEALGVEVLGRIKHNKKFDVYSDSGKVPVLEDNDIREEFLSIINRLHIPGVR